MSLIPFQTEHCVAACFTPDSAGHEAFPRFRFAIVRHDHATCTGCVSPTHREGPCGPYGTENGPPTFCGAMFGFLSTLIISVVCKDVRGELLTEL